MRRLFPSAPARETLPGLCRRFDPPADPPANDKEEPMSARALAPVLAAAASIVVSSAQATPRLPSFKTPTGNIVCGHSPNGAASGNVACGIKTGLKPAPANTCRDLDYSGKRISLRSRGTAVVDLCAGDPGPFLLEQTAPVLGYGSKWRGGGITCVSQVRGLTCRNRDGHGFFMSRARSYRF
jgi:hypothetical protein